MRKEEMILGINLLYLIHNEVGGTETYAIQLLAALEKIIQNKEKVILFINKNTDISLLPRSFSVVVLPFDANSRAIRYFFEQVILPFYLIYFKVSVLHSFGYIGPILFPKKQIITIFDANLYRIPMTTVKKYFYGFFLKWSALNCTEIITSSNFSKIEIMHFLKIKEEKISVIYLGVEKDLIGRRWIGSKSEQKYIFALSNRSQHKNIDRLIKVMKTINENNPNITLKIAGFLPKNGFLVSPYIEVLGYVERKYLVDLYCNSLAFVMPSTYEGFGIPAVESMALGVPTFLSNITSLGEIGKDAAILFDPYDIRAIISSIESVILDDKKLLDLSNACFDRGKEFDWDTTARKVLLVYEKHANAYR